MLSVADCTCNIPVSFLATSRFVFGYKWPCDKNVSRVADKSRGIGIWTTEEQNIALN